jgi:hypothetical protein
MSDSSGRPARHKDETRRILTTRTAPANARCRKNAVVWSFVFF